MSKNQMEKGKEGGGGDTKEVDEGEENKVEEEGVGKKKEERVDL